MPTSSTAKLIAKKQKRFEDQNGNFNGQNASSSHVFTSARGGGFYRTRPKSCKYDSYRLRSRMSVVEENLFGEPLRNKLMARSKSMETISAASADLPNNNSNPGDKLFYKRDQGGSHQRLERPQTALATMRTGKGVDPEFQCDSRGPRKIQIVSKDHVRSLIVPQSCSSVPKPLILSRQQFEKILHASKVLGPEEKAAMREKEMERARNLAKISQERKMLMEASARASIGDMPTFTLAEKEMEEKQHHILQRAQDIKDESMPEVKKLNEYILEAKCQAIREQQMEEKRKRLEEMAEADRHIEEEMEEERQRAVEMASKRAHKLNEFRENYKTGLQQQLQDQEHVKMLEEQRKENELAIRREMEMVQQEMEQKEKLRKKRIAGENKRQMLIELEEAKERNRIKMEELQKDEQRILALQEERRKTEVEKERMEMEKRRLAESERLKIKDQIEMGQRLEHKRDEIKLMRQQEAQDRAWREKELQKAREKFQRDQDLCQFREQQIMEKRELAAKAVQQEKEQWEQFREEWKNLTLKDKQEELTKSKKRLEYLTDLRKQIEDNRNRNKSKKSSEKSSNSESRRQSQDRVQKIRERKLQQLRAYNIPEKYIKEIEKKCQHMAQARFTLSYFGKK